ncbi:Glycosyltransferase involved in cell wall bisynthesis [Desulfotomaculum arcticum]|uniref:Glycosyltransferase involved in cell wall bisynthesis n=1 Tax=Desulfotruncus arcticus DSM 17038 TaxID=1121424 RepID=A0A1I2NYH0_9FIRM|nr:glycosyltransferase family 4 protein [Desulfotruncus arcticus]SFG07869.1 Glycosyltransferase involved in cell wall bisynthesis [Desulfotomaculum arcticum] [Desulfotruncus arcticus DSM 17038]
MNIAMFSDSYYPYVSGVVRSIELFRHELQQLGHNVYIFAPAYRRQTEEEGVFRFPSITAPTNKNFSLALPFAPGVGQKLRDLKIDLVHCHSPFLLGNVGARTARRHNLPLVFTHHTLYDLYVHYVPLFPGLARRLVLGFVRRFCNRCNLVITPTNVVAKRLRELGINAPMQAIPTGLKLEEFANPDNGWLRREYGIGPEEKVILCVARFGKEKNLDMILEAFRLINRDCPDSRLFLVGIGPCEEELRTMAKDMGLASRVTIVGRRLSRQTLTNYYAGADLFMYAAVTETQGIIIGEAQAVGLPVVAVGANGVAEMVNEGFDGFLTAPSAAALAENSLVILQNEELRQRLSSQARESAEQISSTATATRMANAYATLLK